MATNAHACVHHDRTRSTGSPGPGLRDAPDLGLGFARGLRVLDARLVRAYQATIRPWCRALLRASAPAAETLTRNVPARRSVVLLCVG